MRYRNRNTGEERVTVDGSRLDKRVKADPNWEPVPETLPANVDERPDDADPGDPTDGLLDEDVA